MSVNVADWHPEGKFVLPSLCIRVYARKNPGEDGWQSEWVARDVWMILRGDGAAFGGVNLTDSQRNARI